MANQPEIQGNPEAEALQKLAHEQLTAQELKEIEKQGQPLTESLINEIVERRSQ